MVVAGNREHAAERRRAGGVGMLEGIAGAVDAGTFGVPDREYAVAGRAFRQSDLLGTPHAGRGEVLVEAGLEDDVVVVQMPLRRPQFAVIGAERRAAIARHESRGLQSRRAVGAPLHHRQPHQRLHTGQIDAALVGDVFVVERSVRACRGIHGR